MKILGNITKKLTSFYNKVSGQFKKKQLDSSSINEKNIITRKKCCNIVSLLKKRDNRFNINVLTTNEKDKFMATIKEVAAKLGEKIIDIGTKAVIIDVIQSDINKMVETKTKLVLSIETKLKIVDEIEIYINSKKHLITESEDYNKLISLINDLKNRVENGK